MSVCGDKNLELARGTGRALMHFLGSTPPRSGCAKKAKPRTPDIARFGANPQQRRSHFRVELRTALLASSTQLKARQYRAATYPAWVTAILPTTIFNCFSAPKQNRQRPILLSLYQFFGTRRRASTADNHQNSWLGRFGAQLHGMTGFNLCRILRSRIRYCFSFDGQPFTRESPTAQAFSLRVRWRFFAVADLRKPTRGGA